ncbi:MAG: hypothetical protein R3C45_01725 [Phycisphaerales bacterium]
MDEQEQGCTRKPKAQLEIVKLAIEAGADAPVAVRQLQKRHDFTQPQLMTCLVLRAYWKTTYRGVIEQLQVSGELRRAMGLKQLPNYSTLNSSPAARACWRCWTMLSTLARAAEEADDSACREAAMDATGLETSSAGAHREARSLAVNARVS